MESEGQYTGLTRKLNVSIENLYEHNQHILCQIEEGINSEIITSPVVGYQGVPGAYGEEATYTYFKGRWSNLIAHESFEDVIEALLEGKIDYGVLPIENSSAGEVLDTYDLIKNNEVLAKHLHIPLQSGSNTILKNMNRLYDIDFFLKRINSMHRKMNTESRNGDSWQIYGLAARLVQCLEYTN